MSLWGGQGRSKGPAHPTVAETARWLAEPSTMAQAELRQSLDQAAGREADEVALRRVWSRLADLPSILPLSAADRVRVEAEAALTRRARSPWIVAASLAGVTATLAFLLFESKSEVSGARTARIQSTQQTGLGTPYRRDLGDQRSSFVAPATVRTGHGETLQLALRGGTKVIVGSDSVLMLDEDDRPSVSAGEVQFQVPPQLPGHTFTVELGAYRVVVVGTRFNVRRGESRTAVRVDEGIVEIWTDHPVARLGAGEAWSSPDVPTALAAPGDGLGAQPTVARALVEATVADGRGPPEGRGEVKAAEVKTAKDGAPLAHGGRFTKGARASRTVASVSPDTKRPISTPSHESSKPAMTLALSAPTVATAGSTPGAVAASSVPSAGLPGRPEALALVAPVTAAPVTGVAKPAASAIDTAPGPVAAPTSVSAELPPLAIQARTARAAGDARRALGLYRSLAQKGGTAGENAEYEIGRLLRDGLHQPREALTAWRTYRSEHPRGLLRIESDLSIIETLASTGDKAGALAEASDFIRRYPESERRMEVARLAGDLLRERGACAEAVKAYDVALAGGRGRKDIGRDAADSLFFYRSSCLLRDDPVEGAVALKAYLQSFPVGRFRLEAQRLINGGPVPPVARP